MSAKDATYQLVPLVDPARAEPVVIEKHGWPAAVVVSVEKFKRSREGRSDRPKRQSGDARRARLGAAQAHRAHQPDQTKLRLHRSPGGGRSTLWAHARG